MKILIVCVPRTGSTSFTKSLSKTLNIPVISIPDSYEYPTNKKLIEQVLSRSNVIFRMSPFHNTGYRLLDFLEKFDNIILLSRNDIENHFISMVNLYYMELTKLGREHATYSESDIPPNMFKEFEGSVDWNRVKADRKELELLSKQLNIPLLYYEDLYFTEKGYSILQQNIPNLDIKLFKEFITSTKKIKIEVEKTLL